MKWFVLVVLCWSPVAVVGRELLFYAFGDWGEDRPEFRATVAQLRAQPRPRFVCLLGDSFYPKGVRSVDDPRFGLFTAFADIAAEFYVMLGNHDYGFSESPAALVAYSSVNAKWIMPAKYYMRRFPLGRGKELCMFVLDSHVFEPPQLQWLRQSLSSCQSRDAYRIIFTHYPLLTVGLYTHESKVERLQTQLFPVIREFGVHAYVSGHEHQMQAFEREGVHYLISGATAQMNRNKEGNPGAWKEELRFAEKKEAGILAFTLEDDSSLSYKFIRASDGQKLYASTIRLENVESGQRPKEPAARPAAYSAGSVRADSNSPTDADSDNEAISSPKDTDTNPSGVNRFAITFALVVCLFMPRI